MDYKIKTETPKYKSLRSNKLLLLSRVELCF